MAPTTKIRRNNHPDGGLVVFLLMALVMLKEKGVMGQQVPDCASKLVPCANYLNSTTPPDSCCSPLREAVRTELKCLCNLYSDRQIFKSLGINITQALELPKHCGVTSNLTACKEQATAPAAGSSPPSPPSGNSGGSNGAASLAWIGMPGWMGVLLSWASLFALSGVVGCN
ncbi:hypothetical protein AAC387_Pa06g0737 [Persea americana]|eukprot:TRINITY_DN47801_c0_g1_i2.p1 TRINITY_DN47801_c0_g1~~TRINITY_DN47801_c0_g1_i2.p1  ORF type:complete len:171 (+),score=25.88 TRINITY_DN47801_c0_g1_i2:143-655(+)